MSTSVNQTILAKSWKRFTVMNLANWRFLVNNHTNRLEKLHPLMDFNKSFQTYDTLDCTLYQTNTGRQFQKDAALEVVHTIGLNQIADIDPAWFSSTTTREMFFLRQKLLKSAVN